MTSPCTSPRAAPVVASHRGAPPGARTHRPRCKDPHDPAWVDPRRYASTRRHRARSVRLRPARHPRDAQRRTRPLATRGTRRDTADACRSARTSLRGGREGHGRDAGTPMSRPPRPGGAGRRRRPAHLPPAVPAVLRPVHGAVLGVELVGAARATDRPIAEHDGAQRAGRVTDDEVVELVAGVVERCDRGRRPTDGHWSLRMQPFAAVTRQHAVGRRGRQPVPCNGAVRSDSGAR
jgi:hypothetical protein